MTPSRAKEPLMKRLLRWIYPDQRIAARHSMPSLIAYPGVVRYSNECSVRDISVAGLYMITDDRWNIGTGFPITLERTDEAGMGQTLTVKSTVVRSGEDGVAFTFIQQDVGLNADLTKLVQFLKGIPLAEPGAEAVERAV
jgi:hypothetical protein